MFTSDIQLFFCSTEINICTIQYNISNINLLFLIITSAASAADDMFEGTEWNDETGSCVYSKKIETRKQVCWVVGFACSTTQ